MKKKFNWLILLIFGILLAGQSCQKDDNFHSIKSVEREIHNKVNDYRASKGLNTLVEQYLIFEEARKVSNKLANGTYTLGDPLIQDFVNELTQNLGGNSNGWISITSGIENADTIVNAMLDDAFAVNIIEKEYTQSGVGVSEGQDGIFYVCHILINIPN